MFADIARNISIVLVQPKRSSNVGSVARAMNCMGLADLVLVEPRCQIDRVSLNLAVGSEEILEKARIFYDLREALSGYSLVVGTTKRSGKKRHNFITPKEFACDVVTKHRKARIAVLFGPEDYGLSMAHLKECQYLVYIPVNENFGSLNLSQAVMVVAYELRSSLEAFVGAAEGETEMATEEEHSILSRVLSDTFRRIRFPERKKSANTSARLMEILSRSSLSKYEVNLLLGVARHACYMSSQIWGDTLPEKGCD